MVLGIGGWLVWQTVRKLGSQRPVDHDLEDHIRSFLTGACLVGGGMTAAVAGPFVVPGLLATVAGMVMLEAERRDFRRWRTAVDVARKGR